MKRTGEIALGVIGAVISVFVAILGVGLIFFMGNEGFTRAVGEGIKDEDPNVSSAEVSFVIDLIGGYFWVIAVVSIIAVILGIVALVFLRDNKNPVASGIIFLVGAVVGGIFTLPFGIFNGLLYLIAGIMCLVRKPKPEMEEVALEQNSSQIY